MQLELLTFVFWLVSMTFSLWVSNSSVAFTDKVELGAYSCVQKTTIINEAKSWDLIYLTWENNKNVVYYLNKGWVPQTGSQYDYCTIEPLQGALEHHTFFHPIFTGLESKHTVKHHINTFIKLCMSIYITYKNSLLVLQWRHFSTSFSFFFHNFSFCSRHRGPLKEHLSLIQHRIKQGRCVIMAPFINGLILAVTREAERLNMLPEQYSEGWSQF